MSRKKPPAPAPPVASTGCSSLMSCLSIHRRGPQQPAPRGNDKDAPPRSSNADGADAAERCWRRVQLLEEEIRRLTKWLGQEERPAPAATEYSVVRGSAGAGAVTGECSRNGARGSGASASTGTTTTATRRGVFVGVGAGGVPGLVRLEDGSYLHEVTRVGRPWERLALQVSRPVVPADAASAAEVLDKMAAMRAEDLYRFLVHMMPLKDVAGRQNPDEPVRRAARPSSPGDDLLEALVLQAMGKLEPLVLEGLKIQMATSEPAAVAADRRPDEAAPVGKECMVHVVLMQVRDPKERYGAIGDPMIGLIEASLERKGGSSSVMLEMQGIHVAGISFLDRKPAGFHGRCSMWSASLRPCKHGGDGGGDGCRCTCVRNPNRAFQR